ncbi:MAG: type II toxin-antitoxin system RelE/ParE family toxin [Spirochaetales bacterium]|nr:type II toxin-antitoxin system RelE/ParE family toxin [Spirochaetales bacterium]
MVPEVSDPALRERFYGNFRIIYRITDHTIEILTVHHCAMPLEGST